MIVQMRAPELIGTLGNPELYTVDRAIHPESQIVMDAVRHNDIEALKTDGTPAIKAFKNHHVSLVTAQEMRNALNTFQPRQEAYEQDDATLLNFVVHHATESIQKNHENIELTIAGADVFGTQEGSGPRFVALVFDRNSARIVQADRNRVVRDIQFLLDEDVVWPRFAWSPHVSVARTNSQKLADEIARRTSSTLTGRKIIFGKPRVVVRDYDRRRAGNEQSHKRRELIEA